MICIQTALATLEHRILNSAHTRDHLVYNKLPHPYKTDKTHDNQISIVYLFSIQNPNASNHHFAESWVWSVVQHDSNPPKKLEPGRGWGLSMLDRIYEIRVYWYLL